MRLFCESNFLLNKSAEKNTKFV